MVVETFELKDQSTQPMGWLAHGDAEGVLNGEAVRQRVTS